jgi:hypothetical protein
MIAEGGSCRAARQPGKGKMRVSRCCRKAAWNLVVVNFDYRLSVIDSKQLWTLEGCYGIAN